MRRDPLSNSLAAASFGRSVRWGLCMIGSLQWSISLSLPLAFLAFVLLTILPSMIGLTTHNDPPAWRYLAAIWLAGLILQAIVTQTVFTVPLPARKYADLSSQSNNSNKPVVNRVILTVGGVWMAIPDLHLQQSRPRLLEAFGGAGRVLALWSLLLMSIGVACLGCLLVDMRVSPVTEPVGGITTSANSLAALYRPWVAASWIFCLQGFWQLLPLPQSLGRVGWSVVIGLFTQSPDPSSSSRARAMEALRRVQWWIVGIAAATLGCGIFTIQLSGISTESGGRAWPALGGVILLALWQFVSARGDDLLASQLILAANGETGALHSRVGVRPTIRQWRAGRRQRERTRRLMEVAKRERDEASDAARVDEILQRLHAHGRDALSDEERATLSRVSQAIRHERTRNQAPKP